MSVPIIRIDGVDRSLGCLPPQRVCRLPGYTSAYPVIPQNKWVEVDLSADTGPVLYQHENSCASYTAIALMHGLRSIAGMKRIEFSTDFTYGQVNGGRDQGAVIGDVFESLVETGCCPKSAVQAGKIYKPYPQSCYDLAKRYRLAQGFECRTFGEVATALQRNQPVEIGVMIGENFSPNGQGIVPYPLRGSQGGHAMLAVGLKNLNNRWHLKLQNSWSERWGLNGFGYLPEEYFRQCLGAFVAQVPAYGPEEPTGPAVLA